MSAFSITPNEALHDALRAVHWDLLRDSLRYAQRDAQRFAQRDVQRYVQRNYEDSNMEHAAADTTITHLRYRITARSHVFAFVADLYHFASELRHSYGALCDEAVIVDGLAQRVGNLAHGLGDAEDYEGASRVGGKYIYPRDHWATAAHLRHHITAASDLFLVTSELMSFARRIRENHGQCGAAEKADRMALYVEDLAHGLGEDYDGAEEI